MASMDDELAAIERAALAGSMEFTPSVVPTVSPLRPKPSAVTSLGGMGPSISSTVNSTMNMGSQNSKGPQASSGGWWSTTAAADMSKKSASSYSNPNLSPEQQTFLNTLRGQQKGTVKNNSSNNTKSIHPYTLQNMSIKGSDLLVGFPGNNYFNRKAEDDDDEDDDDGCAKPVTKKMGSSSNATGTTTAVTSATATVLPTTTGLQQSTQEVLSSAADFSSDFSDSEEDDAPAYRPTVDPMSRGGEAERIMKKQDEMYDLQMPAHRPYVGGFAAAAYETSREFHYRQKAESAVEAQIMKAKLKDARPPPSI